MAAEEPSEQQQQVVRRAPIVQPATLTVEELIQLLLIYETSASDAELVGDDEAGVQAEILYRETRNELVKQVTPENQGLLLPLIYFHPARPLSDVIRFELIDYLTLVEKDIMDFARAQEFNPEIALERAKQWTEAKDAERVVRALITNASIWSQLFDPSTLSVKYNVLHPFITHDV
jgi:hypothetical protein